MANFDGVFPAGELIPAPCGLLGVASVTVSGNSADGERWLRPGGSAEFITRPSQVRVLTLSESTVANGTVYSNTDSPLERNFGDVEPFFIEIEDHVTGLSLVGQDPVARMEAQLEAITQKAVEYELWTGVAAKESSTDEPYLSKTGVEILTSGGVDPKAALALLEQAIADQSPTGGAGVIHITRDVAAAITGVGSGMSYQTDARGFSYLVTSLGTPVVVGSGYTGSGPDGQTDAAPTASNKWAYVTGPVAVQLGRSEVTNTDASQGFDPRVNDLYLKALRPASVWFDTSIHAAVQITIPGL